MAQIDSPFGDIVVSDLTITQRLFQGVAHRPDEAVLIDGPTGRAMTGAELMDTVRRLAGGLNARGLGAGHIVALMAPNCPEFCAVFHAIAWAGGTVTTINPTYTAHEIRHQLNDAGAEVLITASAFLDTAREAIKGTGAREVFTIDACEGAPGLDELMGEAQDEQFPVDVTEHVVVLPYSSGTTGLPKGVMLTHRNMVVNVDQVLALTNIKPGEVTVCFLPFFHIFGMNVLMNVFLAGGGSLVTMPRFDLEQFLRLTAAHRARQLWMVPPVALALVKHPMVDDFDLSALEYVLSGAAPLGGDVGDALSARIGCTVCQGYGMTELSPVTHLVPADRPRPGAVGLTLPGTSCRIVDVTSGADRGPDEEGELWINGPQVMKGYLNNPEATAETIVEGGWLRTGDLACFDADGYLYIRDRVKELIKVKGFQVAPAEVEAELLTLPGIADAAVIGVPDDEAGEVPIAFVVAAGEVAPSTEEILAHMSERLAHYKLPTEFRFVDTVPKSASGKILRRELRAKLGV